ncbi:NAD(P)H-binding protein [Curtobacterium sp. SL109]|uniref:NAD(P)H-binding protein n=1 Tax=Curtobacterium sp. SL109 TaxID=2994662 RepID=UPI00227277C5|nr:NAD(P)H-binding protein [Curtobacterium sp. SL109]MCY1693716.1 NAD(P)H-binding protein [Curtobacterium sp. SL109]
MTVAVLGATGQLGQDVLTNLTARGVPPEEVVAIGRNQTKLAGLAGFGYRTARADMADPSSVERALGGVSDLLLVSGLAADRVRQHRDTILAARRAGVRRVVYTSVLNADAPELRIADDHRETETYLRSAGVDFTILRNAWYLENHRPDFDAARASGRIVANLDAAPLASATRADLAEAAAVVLLDAATHGGRTYELSGDYAWTYDDFAAIAAAELGRDVSYVAVTDEEYAERLISFGMDARTAGFLTSMNADLRTGGMGITTTDLSALIGRPATTLSQAVHGWAAAGRRSE